MATVSRRINPSAVDAMSTCGIYFLDGPVLPGELIPVAAKHVLSVERISPHGDRWQVHSFRKPDGEWLSYTVTFGKHHEPVYLSNAWGDVDKRPMT